MQQQQQQQDTPGALELPLPTQALLEALQQHLQETLAYPGKVSVQGTAHHCVLHSSILMKRSASFTAALRLP